MSDEEKRRLRELEAEVANNRRLVRLSRQLGSANVYTGLRRVTAVWITGGSAGLILVIAGAVTHSSAVLAAAVIVLVATLIVVGIAAIGVEVAGQPRQHRPRDGPPRPPSADL